LFSGDGRREGNLTKLFKLLGLTAVVSIVNIAMLSPGLIGIEFGKSALETAIGVTVPLGSILVLLYGSHALLSKPTLPLPIRLVQSPEDYAAAITRYRRVKVLQEDMDLALEQMERLRKKTETLLQVLAQRFEPNELSYVKFTSVIRDVETLFNRNVGSVLNRLRVFDESDFENVGSGRSARLSRELFQMRAEMRNELFAFVKDSISANEEILLKLDRLLLEISRLDGFEPGDIDSMACIREIDELIKQTKHYRG